MKPETAEWIRLAEGDFRTANREAAADVPNFEAACFHAQQSIEKYLKAFLVEQGIAFPKRMTWKISLPAWLRLHRRRRLWIKRPKVSPAMASTCVILANAPTAVRPNRR